MLNFKPLTIDDKNIFDEYLKPYTFLTCEYSFTNLFIWRKGLDIQYAKYGDVIIVKKMDFDGEYHFMQPIGYKIEFLKDIVDNLLAYKKENNLKFLFKDAETPFIEDLRFIYGDKFIIEEDRSNFDYIYESTKLISLSGKKLHSKKNHYNNFIKNNKYETRPISTEIIDDCIKTACEWCKKNDCRGYLKYELKAIQELLANKDRLNILGMAVYVDNVLSAFTIGEKANDNMAIIHIEKADTDINGLYAFINKSFVENYFNDIPYINREQDLGIEGLRKAKLSYQPYKLEAKYTVL
jgi:hypothetical protein